MLRFGLLAAVNSSSTIQKLFLCTRISWSSMTKAACSEWKETENHIQTNNSMSPFMIFAVVLTFAYIVYFSVTIMRDLYGKKDGQKDEPETIDVGDMTGEDAPVSVSEDEDGFHIDGNDSDVPYTEQIHGDGVRVIEPVGYVASQEDDIPQGGRAAMTSEQLNEEFAAEADELTPDHEFVATPEEYNIFLQEKHSARSRRTIHRKNTIDEL